MSVCLLVPKSKLDAYTEFWKIGIMILEEGILDNHWWGCVGAGIQCCNRFKMAAVGCGHARTAVPTAITEEVHGESVLAPRS